MNNDNFMPMFTIELNGGTRGQKGDKGDQGEQGIQGIQGPQGEQGETGIQGEKGDTGATGNGIASIEQTTFSHVSEGINVWTVTETNGTTSTFQVKNGEQGEKGDPGDLDHTDIVDNLNSTDNTKVLSAKQGNVLSKIKPFYFDTVADMKAYNLRNGDYVITSGYYSINDNGSAEYYITNTQSNSEYQEELDNGLYASLIIKDYATPEQFGAKGDGQTDDTAKFNVALTYCKHIKSDYTKVYYIKNLEISNIKIEDIIFTGIDNSNNGINLRSNNYIINCRFRKFNKALYSDNSVFSEIIGSTFDYNNYGVYCDVHETGHSINQLKLLNSYFAKNGSDVDNMSGASTPDNGYGVYLNGAFDGCLIEGNVFEYNSFTGIYLINSTNTFRCGCTIIGNYFEGNRDSAIYMYGQFNVRHYILINGNYYSNVTTNVRNTRLINVARIFRSAYNMSDEYPITVYKTSLETGQTELNHTYTIANGSSRYIQFIMSTKSNEIYKIYIKATLNSNLVIADTADEVTELFTLHNGLNEVLTNKDSWFLKRTLNTGESFTVIRAE